MVQTFILCGGKGTRISGGDPTVKKELVEIGDKHELDIRNVEYMLDVFEN